MTGKVRKRNGKRAPTSEKKKKKQEMRTIPFDIPVPKVILNCSVIYHRKIH